MLCQVWAPAIHSVSCTAAGSQDAAKRLLRGDFPPPVELAAVYSCLRVRTSYELAPVYSCLRVHDPPGLKPRAPDVSITAAASRCAVLLCVQKAAPVAHSAHAAAG